MLKLKPKQEITRKKAVLLSMLFIVYIFFFMFLFTKANVILKIDETLFTELSIVFSAAMSVLTAYKATGDLPQNSIRTDSSLPVMVLITTVLTFSGGEVMDNIIGHLLSGFMTVKENNILEFSPVVFVCSVVMAPIAEELIFRYSMRSVLKEQLGVISMTTFTSLLFASVHFYNIQGFLNVFVQAVFLMVIYHYTNNLLITIFTHSLHNALCYLPFDKSIYHTVNGFVLSSPLWFGINSVLTVIALIAFFRYFVPEFVSSHIGQTESETDQQ